MKDTVYSERLRLNYFRRIGKGSAAFFSCTDKGSAAFGRRPDDQKRARQRRAAFFKKPEEENDLDSHEDRISSLERDMKEMKEKIR